MKRTLSLVLSLIMILGIFASIPVVVNAATSGTTGDCTWSLDGTVLTISGNGEMWDYSSTVTLPWGTNITAVVIEDGVTKIGDYVFCDCTRLTSVTIPDSVTNIGDGAFAFCSNLKHILIPNSIAKIGSSAFAYCKKLESITIPDSVTSMDGLVFSECVSLASVTLSNSIKSIGYAAFAGCTNLLSIAIPNSVVIIDYYAFSGCTKLSSVAFGNSVNTIDCYSFQSCTSLSSITIPNSVTSIGEGAFCDCTSLNTTYYRGTKEQWNKIRIDSYNSPLLKNIVYLPATPKVTTTNEIGGVQVKWNAVAGATKYVVYRRQGGYKTWVNIGTTTGTILLDKNVKSGIYYVYSVRAYNSAGQYSDFVSANTNTRKFMATPKLTTIYNHTNGLAIKWNAVAGITKGYRVYRRGAGSTYWTYLGTTKNLYFTDTQVKAKSGEYFRYTVIADGGYHSKFDTTGLYLRRLANPTLTSATSTSAGITVKWGAIKGTTGYYVYRKTANSNWVRIAAVGGTNTTTYLDKTAKKGTTYTYTVRAVCGNVTSSYNSGISCYDKY